MNQDLIGNYLGRYFTYANNGFAGNNFVRMNAPVGWVRYPFADSMPKTVSAFNEIVRLTGTESLSYAWALILRAQSFLRLTDMYGPLPIGAEEEPNAYSSQQKVYHTLVADLDKALGIITPMIQAGGGTLTQFTNSDKVYDGDFTKWVKYANSLKLRMAIRMRLAEPEYARTVAEQAVADGVITSNADNTTILYVPNGLYKTSVEWGDSRACADIESYMTGYNDPRLTQYFSTPATPGDRAIIGCRAGAKIGNKSVADAVYSAAKVTQDTRGIWMTAAEMAFCRAEGALAGWNMGGTVESLYNEGITLSFEQWGASGAADYIANSTATPADLCRCCRRLWPGPRQDVLHHREVGRQRLRQREDGAPDGPEVDCPLPRRPGGLERDPPHGLSEGLPLRPVGRLRPRRAQPSSVRLHGAGQQSRQLSESRAAARRS